MLCHVLSQHAHTTFFNVEGNITVKTVSPCAFYALENLTENKMTERNHVSNIEYLIKTREMASNTNARETKCEHSPIEQIG